VTIVASRKYVSFLEELDRLYLAQHTGPVVIHFAQGVPREVELPQPPVRIVLAKRERSSHT